MTILLLQSVGLDLTGSVLGVLANAAVVSDVLCVFAQASLKTEKQAKKDRAFPQRKFAIKA